MNWFSWVIFIFSGIGILNTTYLVYHKVAGTDVACPFSPQKGCKKVLHSRQSRIFGFPNLVSGLIIYSLIFAFTLMGYSIGSFSLFVPVLILILLGFCFSMYFLYVQARVLKAFCVWCIVSDISFSVMFWALIMRYFEVF